MWICWPAHPMPWLAWQSRHGAMLCRRSLWTLVRELCWWLAWTTLTCALVSKITFNSPQEFQMSQVQKKHVHPFLPILILGSLWCSVHEGGFVSWWAAKPVWQLHVLPELHPLWYHVQCGPFGHLIYHNLLLSTFKHNFPWKRSSGWMGSWVRARAYKALSQLNFDLVVRFPCEWSRWTTWQTATMLRALLGSTASSRLLCIQTGSCRLQSTRGWNQWAPWKDK